jgi:hypothetical protein
MSQEINYTQDPKGYMKLWRSKNKQYAKSWRAHHLERVRAINRKHYERKNSKWRGNIVNNGLKSSMWKEAERLAPYILKQQGFENIFHLSFHRHFDFLAKLDGVVYAFEVTTATQKRLNYQAKELAHYLGIPYYVLFIKPDMSGYRLKQVPLSVKKRMYKDQIGIVNVKLTLSEVDNPIPIAH